MAKEQNMDEILAEVEQSARPPQPKPSPTVVNVDSGLLPGAVGESAIDSMPTGGKTPEELAPAGYPNPLGIQLNRCHLPPEFIEDRAKLVTYVGRYFKQSDVAKISPTENEAKLRLIYEKMVKRPENRPISTRMFCAAVRCIVAGKPLDLPQTVSLDDMAV